MTENISLYVYELTDHIGNVRATVLSVKVTGAVEVLSYTDYYPHGSVMPGRHYESSNGYRYDFQGIEKDAELNWNNFELRMYDANLGRWMSPDPYREFHSPYLAMGNDPINRIDPDGGRSMDIASTEPVVNEDYGRNQVDPFDMIGGGGWREESYQFVNGKLISLEDDPYSPYTLEEQVLGRISASKGVSSPSSSNRSNTDFTVTGIMLPEVNVVDGKIANKNEIVNAVNTFQTGLDNTQSGRYSNFNLASDIVGGLSLGVDLGAYRWDNLSNKQQWKSSYKTNQYFKSKGYNIKTSTIKNTIPNAFKATGAALGIVSGAITVTDVLYNSQINASNILDASVTVASFIPVVGWAIGGGYFAGDMLHRGVYGYSIGDRLDKHVGRSVYNWDW